MMKYHLVDLSQPIGTVGTAITTEEIPKAIGLHSYPNPFTTQTTLRFDLDQPSPVRIVLFNMLGQKILDLPEEQRPAGTHERRIDARQLPPGIYLARLFTGSKILSQMLVKAH